jgi:hypothetical protein
MISTLIAHAIWLKRIWWKPVTFRRFSVNESG